MPSKDRQRLATLSSRKAVPATLCPSTIYKVEAAGIESKDPILQSHVGT
jgi:hypothetical protein